jgi:hypothetical protein
MTGKVVDESLEVQLANFLDRQGFCDTFITRILYAETAPHLTKPGEKEFYDKLKEVLAEDPAVQFCGLDDYPSFPLSAADKRAMRIKFVMMNIFRVSRGVKGGEGGGFGGARCQRQPDQDAAGVQDLSLLDAAA